MDGHVSMCTRGGRGDRSGLEAARTFVERVEWPPGAADVWVRSPVAIAPHTSAGMAIQVDILPSGAGLGICGRGVSVGIARGWDLESGRALMSITRRDEFQLGSPRDHIATDAP